MKVIPLVCCVMALLAPSIGYAQTNSEAVSQYVPREDTKEIRNFPYRRYFTKDKFNRTITFYVSKPREPKETRLPLILCIQGSGSQSVFLEIEGPKGKLIGSGGPEAVITRYYSERAYVLVVEKPGVEFLKQPARPGGAEEGSAEFNREFSLSRWVEAVNAATVATMKLPNVDSSRVLALGHSEGGQVACQIAAVNPKVTHVAVMAGGGPTQLYDLIEFARSGDMYDPDATAEQRISQLLSEWKGVLENPNASDKFFLGHAHLRWSSFLGSSPIEAILKSKAKVFIAQGMADTNSLPASADVLYAELMARGRDCTYLRIEGANHAFMLPGDEKGEGWTKTNRKAVDWFLK